MTRAGASAAITPRWRMVRRCAAGWPSCGRGELVDELRRGLNPPGSTRRRCPWCWPCRRSTSGPSSPCRCCTAAFLALEAGATDLVRRLLPRPLTELLRRVLASPWLPFQAPELFVRLDPARLLAVLRQTRERSVRDWLDETNGRRLENAAAALEALHRPRQARALWQRLAFSDDVHATEDQREQARAALA